MTKLAHVERERAIGMLKAYVAPLVVAKRFRCHCRTIGRLKNRFQQVGTTLHHPRPGRRPVSTQRQDRDFLTSHLRNRFHLASVTAWTSEGTHNPKFRAQTVINRFKGFVKDPFTLVRYLHQIKEPAVVRTS